MTSPDKPLDAAFSELDAYDYELPERLIAQTPRPDRASARMLVVDRATGSATAAFATFRNICAPTTFSS